MTVLVTGGAGLIGMALRDTLKNAGHTVVATDITDFGRDDADLVEMRLDDPDALSTLLRETQVTAIAHCAAISGPMLAVGRPAMLVEANITTTAILLDAARLHGIKRFVNCSSIGVYGNVGAGLITEDTPRRPTSVYGATKIAGEALVDGFAEDYGLDGVSLRIGRVYGPYRRGNCHLGAIIRNHARGQVMKIHCDRDFPYHYVYVDDVAEAIQAAITTTGLRERTYNVGGGDAMTMPVIAEHARQALPGVRIELLPGEDDVPDLQSAFSLERIERDLGWTPRHNIVNGLLAYQQAIAQGRAAK